MSDDTETPQTETPEPQPATPARARSGGGCVLLWLLVLTLQLAMAGFYVYEQHPQWIGQPARITDWNEETARAVNHWFDEVDAELQSLQDATSGLRESMQTLHQNADADAPERAMPGFQPLVDPAMQDRLDALEQTVQALRTQLSEQRVDDTRAERLINAAKQIESVKASVDEEAQQRWRGVLLLTSFERLEHRILSYQPYNHALEAFAQVSEGFAQQQDWISQLSRYQYDGLPSLEVLITRFEAARDAALTASLAEESDGLIDAISQNLSKLVTIRKTGAHHVGNDLQSVLARAAFALEQDDPDSFKAEIASLPEETRVMFQEVLEEMQRKAALLDTVAAIRAAVQPVIQRAAPAADEPEESAPADAPAGVDAEPAATPTRPASPDIETSTDVL